ncbi:myosin light chain kinase family member 4 isoform X2 [Pteronotus mesoamericanus]|uniref:myosin light chain kinase family member 4 isoform X2 n=1 Tax=Pteronotus mesoamericanus TaxID=1884717 RepID=UPI0023EB4C22|nr:myosin light chain kinase family member 4 isoform X2 [Pteronotus parnellii mesoamericanus]
METCFVLDQGREGSYKPSDFYNCSRRMDSPLIRKDIWIVGSLCLISSSLLWHVFRSMMTRGGSRQAPALEDTQAEEKVWLYSDLKETAPVKGKRTSALTDRSSQKNQLSSDKEYVNKLNKKNSEKTNASLVQRNFATFHTRRQQDEVEDFVLRKPIEPREDTDRRDILCTQRVKRQENNSAGDDKQVTVDKTECPVFKEKEKGLHSKEDTNEREPEKKRGSLIANEAVMDKCSNKKQNDDKTNGDQFCKRAYPFEDQELSDDQIYLCITNVKAISTSQVLGNAAIRPIFQDAEQTEHAISSKWSVMEERFIKEDSKKCRTDVAGTAEGHTLRRTQETRQVQGHSQDQPLESAGIQTSRQQDLVTPLDDCLAPPAPFHHRIVTAKQTAINSFYTMSRTEILGGGRFGQVHKCEEKATGLKLAAKIIKTRGRKDKDEVKNEITVMNQLDHVNLIQLYDAFESKNDIVLVMEYVDGGELFDRIIDDNYNLTELDAILFIKQICEGIRHMHQMYILHLDLKPENILCVNRDTKQIKIIDFGLARRYKPREKLKVNFGTPEFLAPEVVNYDFVSFPTDMWSVGVIAYMLLSGLSPFLGDNDAETLNNILACRWDLEEEEFQNISEEAKEFISKLLIKEKSWRISASEALKHPWLSDQKLHSRLKTQENCWSCCCFEIFGKISSSDALTSMMTGGLGNVGAAALEHRAPCSGGTPRALVPGVQTSPKPFSSLSTLHGSAQLRRYFPAILSFLLFIFIS